MSDIRPIDANALKEKVYTAVILEPDEKGIDYVKDKRCVVDLEDIDNAPTVEPHYVSDLPDDVVKTLQTLAIDYSDGIAIFERKRPQGEREFIEILAQYEPDDLCTYPEYRGKPYYSIHFRENGEEFVGYGTYKIEVLSRYLQDYFFGADMRGEKNDG